MNDTPICPTHNTPMLMMYGAGWDYDRWVCPVSMCYEEVELETSTMTGEDDVE